MGVRYSGGACLSCSLTSQLLISLVLPVATMMHDIVCCACVCVWFVRENKRKIKRYDLCPSPSAVEATLGAYKSYTIQDGAQ